MYKCSLNHKNNMYIVVADRMPVLLLLRGQKSTNFHFLLNIRPAEANSLSIST